MRANATVFATGIFLLGAVASVLGNGCGGDDDDDYRAARKGEACMTTNDCAPGLACVPSSNGIGVCVLGVFSVPKTAKECAITECEVAADCCEGTLPATCESDRELCLADAGTSSDAACSRYQAQCVCDESRRDCENNRCVQKCTADAECTSSSTGRRCVGGKCAQCASDEDCGGNGLTCQNGKCQSACESDGDCPGFERCLAGKCAEGGCQTNRECVAATRNVESTCGTDGKCIIPCQTDLECGNPRGYRFFSCVDSQCLYLGCETDKDCRLQLEGAIGSSGSSGTSGTSGTSGSSGSLGSKQRVVCREKQTPGRTTIPAQ